jgi:hypothetical protein
MSASSGPPGVLYHYTGAEGLAKILQTGKLWATDALFLNDSTEFYHNLRLLDDVVDEVRSGRISSAEELKVLDLISSSSVTNRRVVEEVVECFVSCFCEQGDLLSQWRGYGGSVGGFSIGFEAQEIESASKGCLLGPYKFEKVDYDDGKRKRALTDKVLIALHDLPASEDKVRDRFAEEGFNALHYKHHSFSSESEWRIIARALKTKLSGEGLPLLRGSGMGLVPYVELDIRERGLGGRRWRRTTSRGRPLISEIWIGPNAHPELAEIAARSLLASIGFGVDEVMVHRSEVPLRA